MLKTFNSSRFVRKFKLLPSFNQVKRCFAVKGTKSGQAVVPPITTSSTYAFDTFENAYDVAYKGEAGYFYTRWSNPSVEATEKAIAELEDGVGAVLFSSGMAAISSTILSLVQYGDHIILPLSVYAGVNEFGNKFLPNYGINVTFVDNSNNMSIYNNYKKYINDKTKILYVESPSNPGGDIVDLSELSTLGKEYNLITIVDSTLNSPFNQLPLKDHNIDISIHSCTKYLNGHSDVTAGVSIFNSLSLYEKVLYFRRIIGPILSPFDSYLLLRGLKTLSMRMDIINKNSLKIAQYLNNESNNVNNVYYSGLISHPKYEIAKNNLRKLGKDKKMDDLFLNKESGFGGCFSFEINNNGCNNNNKLWREKSFKFMNKLNIIMKGVSLGGMETMIEHPASATHGDELFSDLDDNARESVITEGLLRITVGIEEFDIIINDLKQAFKYIENEYNYKTL